MSYLGDDTNIPLINRGAGQYNDPATAVAFSPGTMLQDFLNSLSPSAPKPLIVQGGNRVNYPEIYQSASSPQYTPRARAMSDLNKALLVAGAAALFVGLGVGGRGRNLW